MKEPEENSNEYRHAKQMLLDRFKIKPEALRIKFTQHQKKPNALWKEFVFELRKYLEGWLEGLGVKDFEELKNLMITDQIKRRVPHEIKDHFVDDWAKFTDPSVLVEKMDEYESVRPCSRQLLVTERSRSRIVKNVGKIDVTLYLVLPPYSRLLETRIFLPFSRVSEVEAVNG